MVDKKRFFEDWRLRSISLGNINIRDISGLLGKTNNDSYLISVFRYAVYRGLLIDKRVLESLPNKEPGRQIKSEKIPVVKTAIRRYRRRGAMDIFGIVIPYSGLAISNEDKEIIDRYAEYAY